VALNFASAGIAIVVELLIPDIPEWSLEHAPSPTAVTRTRPSAIDVVRVFFISFLLGF
jgi:hypothetical protein